MICYAKSEAVFYRSFHLDIQAYKVARVCSIWRSALKRIWYLQYDTHSSLVSNLGERIPLFDELQCRIRSFQFICLSSCNTLISTVCRHCHGLLGNVPSLQKFHRDNTEYSSLLNANQYENRSYICSKLFVWFSFILLISSFHYCWNFYFSEMVHFNSAPLHRLMFQILSL
jgi:hypothetical protein